MDKFVYIKKSVKGHFVALDDELPATAYSIGSSMEDYNDNKWVLLSEEQVQFHDEHPGASMSEVWNMEMVVPTEPTEEELLESAKQEKIWQIEEYDRSENVNSFTINGVPMWLDFDERARIRTSLEAYKANGMENMSKWFNGQKFTFSLVVWEQMLNALEIYAAEALNITEQHKAMVNLANNVESVNNYDYTVDYPNKLQF